MCEPWYQMSGPSYTEVRSDVKKIIYKIDIVNKNLCDDLQLLIEEFIVSEITETRSDFGSYRGYATFGVAKRIACDIVKKVFEKFVPQELDKIH